MFKNSCNPGFVELGNRLGKEKLFDYIYKFGYGKKTGIDLNGESTGILFNLSKVGPVELATTAFGQGVSVTALSPYCLINDTITITRGLTSKYTKKYDVDFICNCFVEI